MLLDVALRNGTIVDGRGTFEADVGIRNGIIVRVDRIAARKALIEIDCMGLAILPGLIDTQVHFREPGALHKEDMESGGRAAVAGGVTTVFDMPNTDPSTTTRLALKDKLTRAEGRSLCNYAFFIGASQENVDSLKALEALPGTPGVKIFMGSSTGSLLVPDDALLERVLRSGISRCPVHSEDHGRLEERKSMLSAEPSVLEHPFLRDAECARRSTERLLNLAAATNRPMHILHVSTLDELPLLAAAKKRSLDVTCEITPQHLWFAAPECYERLGTKAQMNPPIRSQEHRAALRRAVQQGLFDVFGSDHAPHTEAEKAKPYPQSPSGMPGVQTMLPVLLTLAQREKLFPIEQVVAMACENPARIYGIRGKGQVRIGFDADIVVVDLRAQRTVDRKWLKSKCGWSPFEGERLRGWPVHTIVGGKVAMRDGELVGRPMGRPVAFDWKG